LRSGESFEKIAKLNRIITMILDADALRCGQNCASPLKFRGVKTHAHIGDKSAENENEVRGLHILAYVFVPAHRAAVNADVERMVFRNRALTQKIGGDWDVHPLR